MSVSPIFTVHCDGCSQWIAETGTVKEARRIAKAARWARRRRDGRIVDLCPVCADVPCIAGEFSACDAHESWFADGEQVCKAVLARRAFAGSDTTENA